MLAAVRALPRLRVVQPEVSPEVHHPYRRRKGTGDGGRGTVGQRQEDQVGLGQQIGVGRGQDPVRQR